jgi:hypothetical protein
MMQILSWIISIFVANEGILIFYATWKFVIIVVPHY